MSELIYCIDRVQSELAGCLVIQAKNAAKDTTNPVLQWLKLHNKTSSPNSFSFHIAYQNTLQALRLLATTGKLYLNDKNIILDLFGKNDLYYYVNDRAIVPRIKTGNKEFSLSESDFICAGPPHWLVKGNILHLIQTEIAWNDLKKAFYYPEKLRIEELEEDGASLVFVDGTRPGVKEPEEPFPILKLKDRTGAFADLWMDYGDRQVGIHDAFQANRNVKAEKAWEKDLLETDYIPKVVGSSYYYCPLDKVAKSLTFLLELGWQIKDCQGNRVIRQNQEKLHIETTSKNSFSIKGKIQFDQYEADLSQVLGTFNRRENFIQLGQGTVGLLPHGQEFNYLKVLAEETEIITDQVHLKKNCIGLLADFFKEKESITFDTTAQSIRDAITNYQGIEEALPSDYFRGILRPYQQTGVNWLAFLYKNGFHGLLADDMGLGKTIQILAFLSRLQPTTPILIVLPTSLLFNWKKEIAQFLPDWPVYIHHGPNRLESLVEIPNGIILTSYTTLRIDLALFQKIHFEVVILDEAQTIKNSSTQAAQAVFSINASFKISLTGTPLENNLSELWSQFRFLMPELLGNETDFKAEIEAGSSDARHLKKIKRKIQPFFLRRKKEEVAKDLPERIDQTVWIEMQTEQRQFYENYLASIRQNLLKKVEIDGLGQHRMEILETILRLRQICCHTSLLSLQMEDPITESAKLDALMQDLDTIVKEGKKAIVYSQFTSMLQLIAKSVKEKSFNYVYLDGSTKDRESVVIKFQEDMNIPIFLISLKAGGTGLNLTAADYIFLYDPWWNDAVEEQAISRAHRIGRQSTVIAKRYVILESIEEKIMKLKSNKQSLIDNILNQDYSQANLSVEDLKYLLS